MEKEPPLSLPEIVLRLAAVTGTIALVAVLPGIGPMLKLFGFSKRTVTNAHLRTTLSRLKAKGYIVFEECNGHRYARITPSGKRRLDSYRQRHAAGVRRRWDGKWRIVLFDIPERKRHIRDGVRSELIQFGFVRLQDSVWVYPHNCEELVALLKTDYKIGRWLLYIVAESIEYDRNLKKDFHLT